ncbi:MAG TPA: hypothetical protein VH440_11455 [Candidatus Limnocylindrales bacterium]
MIAQMHPVLRFLRKVGIAFGSLVIAGLAVGLVDVIGGLMFGLVANLVPLGDQIVAALSAAFTPGTALNGLVVLVLGGLIYRDILRRERPKAVQDASPTGA